MPRLATFVRREPLLVTGFVVTLIKCVEFAMDSTALFFNDSGAFIVNALGVGLMAERSYVYGWLIRVFAVPFHSLRAIVAMQAVMGGLTAWLLVYVLIRFFRVRAWIAILAGLAFSLDPVQVLYEHMVMTETSSLFAAAIFLLAALHYLESRSIRWLVILGFLGAALVSLRFVYLPVVAVCAVLMPVIALYPASAHTHGSWRSGLALALLVSCTSMVVLQQGYRLLTGRLAHREAAYEYRAGLFLVSTVAPIIEPSDTNDARVVKAILDQNRTTIPLSDRLMRPRQMWFHDGFVARLQAAFQGDQRATDRAAAEVARHAIRRNPLGFFKLAVSTYFDYWRGIRYLRYTLPWESGATPVAIVNPSEVDLVYSAFGVDVSEQRTLQTFSRRYQIRGREWYLFLLASPVFGGLSWRLVSRNRRGAALFFLWSCLLMASVCIGGMEVVYRYLHPFSFTGIAACALLADQWMRSRRREPSPISED